MRRVFVMASIITQQCLRHKGLEGFRRIVRVSLPNFGMSFFLSFFVYCTVQHRCQVHDRGGRDYISNTTTTVQYPRYFRNLKHPRIIESFMTFLAPCPYRSRLFSRLERTHTHTHTRLPVEVGR